jgi:hypothetical protein
MHRPVKPLRLGDVREYYAAFMTKHLNTAEISFLEAAFLEESLWGTTSILH